MADLTKRKLKLKKGYSLLEIIISLAIMAVVITIMFSTLILGLQISVVSLARSVIREELSNISSLISRDIRNSDFVLECGSLSGSSASCKVVQKGETYLWSKCNSLGISTGNASTDLSICKFKVLSDGSLSNIISTSKVLVVNDFDFSYGFSLENSIIKSNIVVTIVAAHKTESFGINNVIKQIAVSTRNF